MCSCPCYCSVFVRRRAGAGKSSSVVQLKLHKFWGQELSRVSPSPSLANPIAQLTHNTIYNTPFIHSISGRNCFSVTRLLKSFTYFICTSSSTWEQTEFSSMNYAKLYHHHHHLHRHRHRQEEEKQKPKQNETEMNI